jgi:hemerythrin
MRRENVSPPLDAPPAEVLGMDPRGQGTPIWGVQINQAPAAFWHPQLSVAVAALDAQHRHIFQRLALARQDLLDEQPRAALSATLDDLIDCIRLHFAGEELLMASFGHADFFAHQLEHQRLSRILFEFQEQFAGGGESLVLPLLDFVEGWLVRHILESDRLYSAFFAERGAIP